MATRTVFEGEIAVSGEDYAGLENLDERVTTRAHLRFTLDYPFENPHDGEVRTDGGASLRHIIDAIRSAYRTIYSGTTSEPMEHLDNKRVRGAYGEAFHTIDDLVIESIELDDETGRLEIFIGS